MSITDICQIADRDNPLPLGLRAQAAIRLNRIRRERELEVRVAREHAQVAEESMREQSERVRKAVAHPYVWVTEYTETYNEQWVTENRPSPYEPFPRLPYFEPLFDIFLRERIVFIEKARDMMCSWGCVAFLTWMAMRTPQCGTLVQCQKEDKVIQLIDYAKCLYRRQPAWLKEAFPLAKRLEAQGSRELEFAHGGYIAGVPGGADQVRSYHPVCYLNDESSFQPDAGECFDEVLAAVSGSIIFNSSAGPSWFADIRRDIVRRDDE